MDEIFFKGVRCFHELHSCPLKPITLLVGENSSGKSTFLALNRIAWDIAESTLETDFFNEDPFLLGSYDQIASYRGGKAGRARSFTIGSRVPVPQTLSENASNLFGDHAEISARFYSDGSQSWLETWTFKCGDLTVLAKHENPREKFSLTIKTPRGDLQIGDEYSIPIGFLGVGRLLSLLSVLMPVSYKATVAPNRNRPANLSEADFARLRDLGFAISQSLGPRPFAFAPIRTRPQRTYDPLKDDPKPEGSHVPMVLAKTLLDSSNESEKLRSGLISFGKASGLFNGLTVKRKGQKDSDPFQIAVKILGPSSNLVDVGYGVSQVLPIIVDVVQSADGSSFLLQQPEVHLHPKAQAELGSFLATQAKEKNKRFVIETHSDYLIDRIRMDIRDKQNIGPNDVVILYFERGKSRMKIHRLDVDEYGNILHAPPTYRKFFLDEERRLLGI